MKKPNKYQVAGYLQKTFFDYWPGLIGILALFIFFGYQRGCGGGQPTPAASETTAGVGCNGTELGSVRSKLCPAGQQGEIKEVCQGGTWAAVSNTCAGTKPQCVKENDVTFNYEILPITQRSCALVGCHDSGVLGDFTDYARVSQDADKMLAQVKAGTMPKGTAQKLSTEEIALLEDWIRDGKPLGNEGCETGEIVTRSFSEMLADMNAEAISRRQQAAFTRFLTIDQRLNLGASAEEIAIYKKGTEKALNLLNKTDDVARCDWTGVQKSQCAFDCRDLGWSSCREWEIILDGEPFNVLGVDGVKVGRRAQQVSVAAEQLRQLTKTQQPFLHADVFMQFAHERETYYGVMGIPATLKEYLKLKGVNLEQAIIDKIEGRDVDGVTFMGTSESPLGLNHRLVTDFESRDGRCSITCDFADSNAAAGHNLFETPLWVVGKNRANCQAGEVICDTRLGLNENSLWALRSKDVIVDIGGRKVSIQVIDGDRQNQAPEEIVADYRADRVNPFIQDADSCEGCHTDGFRNISDEIRAVYLRQGDIDDIPLVEALYALPNEIAKFIDDKRKNYVSVLGELGIDITEPSQIIYGTNRLRKNQTFAEFCAFVLMTADGCQINLERSVVVKSRIGGLLTGQSVPHNAILDVFKNGDLQREFRLGEDPLGR